MPTLTELHLSCTFPDGWQATKFDDWHFYQRRFKDCCGGNKAVDFLAHDTGNMTLWLVELKDYRQHRRTKDDKISLWEEVAVKVRHTLAGVFAAAVDENHPDHTYAVAALKAKKLRVVLHLEQPRTHTKLFPRSYNPANVQQKLKQLLKPIDAHPRVTDLDRMAGVPWTAASLP